LSPQTGIEFSAVTGFTYNFTNNDTDYKNGIDWHVDWGASHFLSKQMFVGIAGYYYHQLTGDSGSGQRLALQIAGGRHWPASWLAVSGR
jgi:hypothetical protein